MALLRILAMAPLTRKSSVGRFLFEDVGTHNHRHASWPRPWGYQQPTVQCHTGWHGGPPKRRHWSCTRNKCPLRCTKTRRSRQPKSNILKAGHNKCTPLWLSKAGHNRLLREPGRIPGWPWRISLGHRFRRSTEPLRAGSRIAPPKSPTTKTAHRPRTPHGILTRQSPRSSVPYAEV